LNLPTVDLAIAINEAVRESTSGSADDETFADLLVKAASGLDVERAVLEMLEKRR
jgi:hypothetical protein